MPFDGIYIHAIKEEIQKFIGYRIDRINQPTKDEIIITLRKPQIVKKLLISANSSNARIHFTENPLKNPQSPPMFCMLLRKKLTGGKLKDVKQLELDRVLFLEFETKDEIGDKKEYVIAVEPMGKHSNIIVYDKKSNIIIDSIKRVNEDMSVAREVYPKKIYVTPPLLEKINIKNHNIKEIIDITFTNKNMTIESALLKTIMGISPLIARELTGEYLGTEVEQLNKKMQNVVRKRVEVFKEKLISNDYDFIALEKNCKPCDFSAIDINQFGDKVTKKHFQTASALLDFYYEERDKIERTKQKSKDLIRTLNTISDRTIRKLNKREEELKGVDRKEKYKLYGDIINSNLYNIEKGNTLLVTNNFYSNNEKIEIKLNPYKTPQQNAQAYYKGYKKSKSAEVALLKLINEAKEEIEYIQSALDFVMRTENEDEITEIKEELTQQGYLKYKNNKKIKDRKFKPLKYKSSDGYTILCGRNNIQNDELTMKIASKKDIWLHTQKIHGAHVIIKTDNQKIPKKTMEEAAMIATYNSKARSSNKVAVDFTYVSNVKKPPGSKPGMVIYNNFKTIIICPDSSKIKRMIIKD